MVQEQRSSDERVLGMSVRAVGSSRTLGAVLVAGSLALAGCGGSSSGSSAAVETPPAGTSAVATAAPTESPAAKPKGPASPTTTVIGLLELKGSKFHLAPSKTPDTSTAPMAQGVAALGEAGLQSGLYITPDSTTKVKKDSGGTLTVAALKKKMTADHGSAVVRVQWTFKKPPTSLSQLAGKAPSQITTFS